MKVIENKTKYKLHELIKVAQRENNTKRNYLLVNPIQAKHLPVNPKYTLGLFSQLGNQLKSCYRNDNVVIIGFAETATAIGAAVAACFKSDTKYIQTSRENITECDNIVNFAEEHSHATEQKLFCSNPNEFLKNVDRIIFVEDEITTGKTILNFIKELKDKNIITDKHSISAASIINAMNKENMQKFENISIACHYLLKIENNQGNHLFPHSPLSMLEVKSIDSQAMPAIFSIPGRMDSRIGVVMNEYKNACDLLAYSVIEIMKKSRLNFSSILVLGTEEFMYPPILVAKKISEEFNVENVRVHSTTRSPIVPCGYEDYPIKSRSKIMSFYCNNRQTFIYNLEHYDQVIIITDSETHSDLAFLNLVNELNKFGCNDIVGIRWVR